MDVSKIFSPHYTGVGPYIIVSRITDILYLRYYNSSLQLALIKCSLFFSGVVVFAVIDGFCCYKFRFMKVFFGVCGFLFVKQMKREPPANTPKNVKRIAPSSG